MNPAVLLQLILDLQETVMRLRAENAQLRAQAAAAPTKPPAVEG